MGDQGFHSWSYHRHFEDHEEKIRIDSRGKRRIERVYTGTCYRRAMSGTQDCMVKTGHLFLYVAAAILFLRAAAADVESNRMWYVFIPETADLLILLWLLKVMVFYLTAPKTLTIGEYRSDCRQLMLTSVAGAVSFGLTAAGLLYDAAVCGRVQELLLPAAQALTGAICMAAIAVLEKKIKYVTWKSNENGGGWEDTGLSHQRE